MSVRRAVRRVHEELSRTPAERAAAKSWCFKEGMEKRWLDHLSKVPSDGIVIMAAAYLSLSDERQRRFLHLSNFKPGLPPKVQEFARALRRLPARNAAEPEGVLAHTNVVKAAVMAGCAVGVVGIGGALSNYSRSLSWSDYSTAFGEQRAVQLSDGSAVDLNTASKLKFKRSKSHRIAVLVGEARFHPAADPDRPFVVFAGRFAIRDVGTDYTVRLHEDGQVDVMVFDGEILMSHQVFPGPLQKFIKGSWLEYELDGLSVPVGHLATTKQGEPVRQAIAPTEMERRDAWRRKQLNFVETPLDEVVRELGRYDRRQIVIVDPSIASVKFNGNFSTTQAVTQFLLALRYTKEVRYTTSGSGDTARIELTRGDGREKTRQ